MYNNTLSETTERSASGMLTLKGSTHFRQRIACATLTGTKITIDEIRLDQHKPGLTEYESSFLRLVEKLTNGCEIIINETGTRVVYKPGFIVGGKISHDCGNLRSISYFLEGIIALLPFGKEDFHGYFHGLTNEEQDCSVDLFRTVTIPLLRKFGISEGVGLKIKKRGAPPGGGGLVELSCPIMRELKPVQLLEEGQVRRIRGIAYATRMSPQTANRLVDSARGFLSQYQQDIYIYTDHYKGESCGLSPGFGLALVAETTTGCALSAEAIGKAGIPAEQVGQEAALNLLQEIANRGCVDSSHQSLALLLMVLCPDSVCQIRLGKLTPYTIQFLRHLRDFFGVVFKLEGDPESKTTLCTCQGSGFKNLSKRVW